LAFMTSNGMTPPSPKGLLSLSVKTGLCLLFLCPSRRISPKVRTFLLESSSWMERIAVHMVFSHLLENFLAPSRASPTSNQRIRREQVTFSPAIPFPSSPCFLCPLFPSPPTTNAVCVYLFPVGVMTLLFLLSFPPWT